MATRNVPVIVTLSDEQYETIATYQGQFMRDLPETEAEKDQAIDLFVQDLVEQWIDYYENDAEYEDEEEFDEMGPTALQ